MTTSSPIHFIAAFATGGLLSLMVLFNGTLAAFGSLYFSSFVPHLTGSVAAVILLLALRPAKVSTTPPPLWAYLGGVSGAITVMLTSAALNSALALSGTIALGLAGQVVFSLIADKWGLMGLPQRDPTPRDFAAIGLIIAGSLILIFLGRG